MNKDGSNPLIIFRPWDSSSVSDISAESLATNHNDRKFLKIESKNFDNQLKNNGHKSCDQIDKNKSTMTIEPLINYPQIPPSIHNYRPRPHPNLFSLFHQESTKCSPLFSGNIKNIVPKMFPGSGTGYEFSEYFFQHCAFNSSNIQRSPVISNMPPPPSSSATSINSLNSFGPNLFGAYLPNIVDNKTNVNNNNPLMASKEMHLDFVKESMIKFMNPSDLNKHQQMGIESASNANFCPTIPGNTNLGKKQRPKRFQCPHCQVSFSNNGQLKGHIRIHTGERPFICDHQNCGKTFTRNEELTRHKRIHTGLRPFACSICNKRFGRKDHLKKHVKTHQRPPPIPISLASTLAAAAYVSPFPYPWI